MHILFLLCVGMEGGVTDYFLSIINPLLCHPEGV